MYIPTPLHTCTGIHVHTCTNHSIMALGFSKHLMSESLEVCSSYLTFYMYVHVGTTAFLGE